MKIPLRFTIPEVVEREILRPLAESLDKTKYEVIEVNAEDICVIEDILTGDRMFHAGQIKLLRRSPMDNMVLSFNVGAPLDEDFEMDENWDETYPTTD